jgi:hypothetical protein
VEQGKREDSNAESRSRLWQPQRRGGSLIDSTHAAMQYRCCLSSLHKCSTPRALLHGHGHAAAQQHGAVVSDEVKVEVELEVFRARAAHAHEVGCACPALRGCECAKRESPSRFRADAIWWLIDEACDGESGIRSCALHVDGNLCNENGVVVIMSGGRDVHMACALATDRRQIALEARFRMSDGHEGEDYKGQ